MNLRDCKGVLLVLLLSINVMQVTGSAILDEEFDIFPNESVSREFEVKELGYLKLEVSILQGNPTIDTIVIYEFEPSENNLSDPRDFLQGGGGCEGTDQFCQENVSNGTFNVEIDKIGFYKIKMWSSKISKVHLVITTNEDSESDAGFVRYSSLVFVIFALVLVNSVKQSKRK